MEIEIQDDASSSKLQFHFDSRKARINIIISLLCKILLLILAFFCRRLIIKYLGNDYNGINSLFNNIFSFLAVADLGIGTAITYCMYEPIVSDNKKKLASLYSFFKKIYFIIGLIILFLGIFVSFFLKYIAKDFEVTTNIYFSYFLCLISVIVTYFYSAKMSLINAYKNNYISTLIVSIGTFFQYIVQIIILYFSHSFILYCLAKILCSIMQLFLFCCVKKYNPPKYNENKIDNDTLMELKKNIKALFLHKIGDVIFGTVDSLVISSMIGVSILGYYSNYLLILTSMNEIIKLFFVSLTSIIGHMGLQSNIREKKQCFKFFYILNYVLGIIFYLGYYAISDELIEIILGEGLEIDKMLLVTMTITYFIQFMRQSVSVFKDSFGLFYYDRYNSIIAAILNVILSILFAYFFGIYGVLLATIIVDLLLYHIVEPFVLYKYSFKSTPIKYYVINYFLLIFFAFELFAFKFLDFFSIDNIFLKLFLDGILSVGLNIVIIIVLLIIFKPIKFYKENIYQKK